MADEPVLTVRGEVVREVPPELARFATTVTVRHADRQQTLAQLAERTAAIRAIVDGYRTAVDRRETGELWVRPEFRRSRERVTGYHGSVTTTITVSDFAVLAELMLQLAGQEQNSVNGPWWELRPDSPAYQRARRAAVADAFARARQYAEVLGVRLTGLRELTDHQPDAHPMLAVAAGGYGGGAGAPELDLDPQPQSVRAAVVARFSISPPDLAVAPITGDPATAGATGDPATAPAAELDNI